MNIDRATLVEVAVSVGTVAIMIGVMSWIGVTHGGDALSPEGGKFLVYAIIGFVALMAAIGYGLAYSDLDM